MSRDAMHSCVTPQRMRQLRGHKENTTYPIVARSYFGRGLEKHVYGALAWQWVFTLQYM
jgi:hypothetical protein